MNSLRAWCAAMLGSLVIMAGSVALLGLLSWWCRRRRA